MALGALMVDIFLSLKFALVLHFRVGIEPMTSATKPMYSDALLRHLKPDMRGN